MAIVSNTFLTYSATALKLRRNICNDIAQVFADALGRIGQERVTYDSHNFLISINVQLQKPHHRCDRF